MCSTVGDFCQRIIIILGGWRYRKRICPMSCAILSIKGTHFPFVFGGYETVMETQTTMDWKTPLSCSSKSTDNFFMETSVICTRCAQPLTQNTTATATINWTETLSMLAVPAALVKRSTAWKKYSPGVVSGVSTGQFTQVQTLNGKLSCHT